MTIDNTVTISVDALGGDYAPSVVLDGVRLALAQDSHLKVLLCGPDEVVTPFASNLANCEAVATTEFIDMHEHPANAVRKKKDSSVVVACRLVKEGRSQGFFSAGSTGACLAAATLVMGRIKGVKRPALFTVIPSPERHVILGDVGANADCKPEYLLQFAKMGSVYAHNLLDIKNPRVALLNNGEEDTKGSIFAQDTHNLLKEKIDNFAGNAEGHDLLAGKFDVYVTDGFTGNVCLKTIEGTSKVLMKAIKGVLTSSAKNKLAAAIVQKDLKALGASMSADTYGGAPLLGVMGACIVGHGSSNKFAIANGIHATSKIVRSDISSKIALQIAGSANSDVKE